MTYRKLAARDTGQLYTGHCTKMTPLSFEELPCIMNPETEKTYSIPEINARFSILKLSNHLLCFSIDTN